MTGAAKPKKKTWRRRIAGKRGALWVIAALLITSAVFRLGGGVGQAIAREVSARAEADLAGDPAAAQSFADCGTEADIAEVLAGLRAREVTLETRESALEDRLQALAVAEAQIGKNLTALMEAEVELESTMALATSAAEDDLSRLTAVYENMKPKEAAPLFAAMDPDFAAGFLGRMRADAAAAIMAGLDPENGYAISVILAGRNADVPTN